jgi:hypothetical protein
VNRALCDWANYFQIGTGRREMRSVRFFANQCLLFEACSVRLGSVWVADNWETPDACWDPSFSEAKSTQRGSNGLTVFYGMAKPVRAPQIGPARPY